MNSHQFNEKLEKLRRAPVEAEVLKLVLAGHTNAEIAGLRDKAQGTIRQQISKIYKKFGIKSEFPGDPSQRDKLKALFRQHKPEWITNYPSISTNQISEEGQQEENERDKPPLLLPSTQDEDLMSLATGMLEQLGFDQKFKVSRAFQHIGYRLKNPGEGDNPFQLVLAQRKEGLCISIPKNILEPYVLSLKYWEFFDLAGEICPFTKGTFWILPSKKDIFLESLHPNYWSLLQVEGKTVGNCYLNKRGSDGSLYGEFIIPGIPLEEFSPDTLSDTDTYLVLSEDKLFPYTWQAYLSLSEVLEEFLCHIAKKIIENQ
jgi:hypothetical protein